MKIFIIVYVCFAIGCAYGRNTGFGFSDLSAYDYSPAPDSPDSLDDTDIKTRVIPMLADPINEIVGEIAPLIKQSLAEFGNFRFALVPGITHAVKRVIRFVVRLLLLPVTITIKIIRFLIRLVFLPIRIGWRIIKGVINMIRRIFGRVRSTAKPRILYDNSDDSEELATRFFS